MDVRHATGSLQGQPPQKKLGLLSRAPTGQQQVCCMHLSRPVMQAGQGSRWQELGPRWREALCMAYKLQSRRLFATVLQHTLPCQL